jgi:DNA (cytosine-5)-methyltransferase 1
MRGLNEVEKINKIFIDTSKLNQKIDNSFFNVTSLFSGAGGKDLGLLGGFNVFGRKYSANNFKIRYANDIMKEAVKTYKQNFTHEIELKDIREVNFNKLGSSDIVIGGFPCQDFSTAGNRLGFDSERGLLYLQMKRVIQELKPIAFVAENVQGLTNLNGTQTIDKIVSDISDSGYYVSYHLLNAADFLVPQSRKRVFIIGIRKDERLIRSMDRLR